MIRYASTTESLLDCYSAGAGREQGWLRRRGGMVDAVRPVIGPNKCASRHPSTVRNLARPSLKN